MQHEMKATALNPRNRSS